MPLQRLPREGPPHAWPHLGIHKARAGQALGVTDVHALITLLGTAGSTFSASGKKPDQARACPRPLSIPDASGPLRSN